MAAESIIDYKKPEFPKIENTESGTITRIEYIGNGVTGVGDAATISAALPAVGDKWGNYAGLVKSVSKEPKENTDILEVFITVEQPKDNTDIEPGERVSVRRVSARLAYSEMTVLHALQTLRSLGLITMQQSGSGHPAEYRICKTDD